MDRNTIVYESCRNLRALARNSLAGRWNLALMGTLVYFALTTIPVLLLNAVFGEGEQNYANISYVYNLLISGPMILGYAIFCISIFRRRETSPAEVFYGFERFGKAFGLYMVIIFFTLLWSLLFIIPGIIAAIRYSMSFYILADYPNIGIMEALNRSKAMMRGNIWKFLCLNLSFLGWVFLCTFTFGIGLLWLLPYTENAMIAFYDIANGSLRSVRALESSNELFNENRGGDV